MPPPTPKDEVKYCPQHVSLQAFPALSSSSSSCCCFSCSSSSCSSSTCHSQANVAANSSTSSSHEASAWKYKVVRGSLYVVGPAIETLAEAGHAYCMDHTTSAAAAPACDIMPSLIQAEDIAFFADARRRRAQRDGPAHHLTLLHRTEIQAEGEKEAGIEDCGGRDRDDNTASAVDTPAPTPTSPTSTGASIPCKPERKKRVDENELLSSAPSRRSSHATTMPEDKAKGDEKETQEQEGTKIMRKGADPYNSTEGVPRSFSSPSSSMDRYKDDDKDEAFASALLAMLTLLLNTNLLPHIPPLLYDPLPLYVYRTSGEGRALAMSVLFLPGEWLRYWQGRAYHPLHVTLGFERQDERDQEARRWGRVRVLGYGLSRRRTAEVLEALVNVLVKGEGEGEGRKGGQLGTFLPRVRDLAVEVMRVLERRIEGRTEGGRENEEENEEEVEEEEEEVREITATLTACRRILDSMAGGSASGLCWQGKEEEKETPLPLELATDRRVRTIPRSHLADVPLKLK
ncbi:hypothetical protein VYU27_007939 [Nannochloropsis oceanica]